jgi:hypothetical protein
MDYTKIIKINLEGLILGKCEVTAIIIDWFYALKSDKLNNSCINLGFVIVAGQTRSSSDEYSELLSVCLSLSLSLSPQNAHLHY